MPKETLAQCVERYKQTYSGRELLKNHSLSDTGLWRVRGEDEKKALGLK